MNGFEKTHLETKSDQKIKKKIDANMTQRMSTKNNSRDGKFFFKHRLFTLL